MADKSFGVKELNLISASGTPTITSPNSVNINATNVAISTDITVGGMVSLGAGTSISSPGTNVLTFGTNSTEKVRITSAGLVGIGTDAPSGKLNIVGSDTQLLNIVQNSGDLAIRLNDRGTGSAYIKVRDNTSGSLSFDTGGSERVRITSGGDVGINTTSNNDGAHFQHYQSEARHQSFQSTNGDLAIVTDNNSNPAAYIKGTGTADLLKVVDNTTEVFTIKDGGNIGMGGITSPSFTTGGGLHLKRNYGIGFGDGSSGRPDFQIATTNGSSLDFRCGFGADTADISMTTGGNLVFANGGGIDFSATANSSGTMSSELLDDYEEGTWTPTITGLGNHNNNAGSTWGKYTKIGNRVFITWRYSWTSRTTTNGGVVFLGSLPFGSANDSKADAVYIGGLEGIISNSGREVYGGNVLTNSTTIQFRASGHNVSENSLFGSLSTSMSSGYIYGGANYIVP